MTRRLTLAILGVVVATLVVTGLGTLALSRLAARDSTEDDLRVQATASAELLKATGRVLDEVLDRSGVRPARRPAPRIRLNAAREALDLEELDVVVLTADGEVDPELSDPLPASVPLEELDVDALRRGETVSGHERGTVFAAAAFAPLSDDGTVESDGVLATVLLTRGPRTEPTGAWRWFLVSATGSLLAALLVTLTLSRRLTRPLRAATEATTRIAEGDLAARVPTPGRRSDELAELGRSINEMAGALERSRGLEQQFLLSVSHDLRTPLTNIRGYAEAIADGTAGDGAAAASVILAQSRRLERLVRDLLDLARLDARQFSLDPTTVDLGQLAREVADGFAHEVEQAGLRLDVEVADHEVRCRADADRLGQVVANLVENAVRYADGVVRITVDGPGAPTLEVTDDGPGIDPADLPHVFERLYQARHRPRREETGSGLGLAIVRELATAMGGSVEVHSALGLGTRMVVTLPPAPDSPEQRELADLGGAGRAVPGDRDPGGHGQVAGAVAEGDDAEPG